MVIKTKFVGTIYQTSDTGIVRVPVYRGIWVSGNTYYYYDQVSHKGSLWICMDPNGTKDEPNENDDQWQEAKFQKVKMVSQEMTKLNG